jgi:hypothetical protein
MPKLMTLALLVAGAMTGIAPSICLAAELLVPPNVPIRHHHTAPAASPCGCLQVTYVYHREVRTTYGTGFDPRNFDQTEPYFYLGRTRAYPRYWVSADPMN